MSSVWAALSAAALAVLCGGAEVAATATVLRETVDLQVGGRQAASVVEIAAGAGEGNRMSIAVRRAAVTVADAGAQLSPGAGCAAAGDVSIECRGLRTASGRVLRIVYLRVNLADGEDTVEVEVAHLTPTGRRRARLTLSSTSAAATATTGSCCRRYRRRSSATATRAMTR
jgi:hypothetical protein